MEKELELEFELEQGLEFNIPAWRWKKLGFESFDEYTEWMFFQRFNNDNYQGMNYTGATID